MKETPFYKKNSFWMGITIGSIAVLVIKLAIWCALTNGHIALIKAIQYPEYVSTLELQKKIVVKK